jgi:hypothetical protein
MFIASENGSAAALREECHVQGCAFQGHRTPDGVHTQSLRIYKHDTPDGVERLGF